MYHTPRAAVQRRRIERLLRSVDVYVVFAVLGVFAYIVVVNLVAEAVSMDAEDSLANQLATSATTVGGAAAARPASVYWPHKWPADSLAELKILHEGLSFVETSLTRLAPLLTQLPAAQLAVWDLLLLTKTKTSLTPSVAELRRVVQAMLAQTPSPSSSAMAAAREAVESAIAVWTVRGMTAEVAEAEKIRLELLNFPSSHVLPINLNASSWEAFSNTVWEMVACTDLKTKNNFHEVYQDVLNVSSRYWRPADGTAEGVMAQQQLQQGPLLPRPLVNHHLLPLLSGSFDTVVPLTRLLLHLWVLGGRQDTTLVTTYDKAIEAILKHLLHTRTVNEGSHAMNFTFVASATELVVPVATPRTCALTGLLAQGVRYGAHHYSMRPVTAQFSEDDVLQAAEALATSCFQQYADPAGHRLRTVAYVTSSGSVVAYMAETNSASTKTPKEEEDVKSTSALESRSSLCDVPAILVESFHELYLTTEDPMYGLWSLLVMSDGISDHCSVSARDFSGNGDSALLRYVRELRGLWLLFHRMDCVVYRRSRGTRGVCDVTATTMVSPATGHLVRLPPQKAS